MEIKVGQIYEVVTENFLVDKDKKWFNRNVKLDLGEKIEIRFPFAWNFRTVDNNYFHATPEMIKLNCVLLGTIWENVRSGNEATLEEILRIKLYDRNRK